MQRAARVTLLLVVLAILGLLLVAAIPHLRGLDTTVANGGSMEPLISRGSLVVAKRVATSVVEPGDVIIYIRGSEGVRVTHRVADVVETAEGTVLRTKGDANRFIDPEALTFDQPVSRVEFSVPYVGYLIMFSRTITGKVLLLAVPLALLVVGGLRSRSLRAGAAASKPAHLILPVRDPRQTALPLD